MRSDTSPDVGAVQPRLLDRVATSLGRYRLNGKRSRTLRRILAVALLVAAAAMTMSPTAGTAGDAVLVTARDLPSGATLAASDVSVITMASPPDGALSAAARGGATGQVLSGAMRRGEVLTDARVLSERGPDPGSGRSAIPVPLQDAALVDLLRPGMAVDLVRLPQTPGAVVGSGGAEAAATEPLLSTDAVVLSIPDAASGGFGAAPTRIVIVAVRESAADAVTAAASMGLLTVRFSP